MPVHLRLHVQVQVQAQAQVHEHAKVTLEVRGGPYRCYLNFVRVLVSEQST